MSIVKCAALNGSGGSLARPCLLKGLAVVPRHPRRWGFRQLLGVFLQFGEVVERIGVAQLAVSPGIAEPANRYPCGFAELRETVNMRRP